MGLWPPLLTGMPIGRSMFPHDQGFGIGFPWNGGPNQIWIDLMPLTLADANRVIAGQEDEDCARAGVEKL